MTVQNIKEMKRNFVNLDVNPCKMCMPMGASLAFKGIEDSMVIIHGSQGCSTYIRRHMATHFNEPIDIASSSLSEQGTVYGGASNLIKGIKNVVSIYQPKVIGILTTCLAETIGEDVNHIIEESGLKKELPGIDLIAVQTPGYGAGEYKGYWAALRKTVEYYAKPCEKNDQVNIIINEMTAQDIRELKRILKLFNVNYAIFPDISETLDGGFQKRFDKKAKGGTTREELMKMAGAKATIEFGKLTPVNLSPGRYLEDNYGVKLYSNPIPIGLEGTDMLIMALSEITGEEIPQELKDARGRMLDGMIDSHKFNREGRAAIYGNPELIYAVSSLCIENGVEPIMISTATDSNGLKDKLKEKLKPHKYNPIIIEDTDFETIQSNCVENHVNILIGNSDGKFIHEKEHIDLIRIGFPIHDQVGAARRLYIGYEGSMRFLDEITNTLLDRKHNTYREDMYKEYYA